MADELIRKMCACGAHLITPQETEQLLKVVFLEKDGKYSVNKKWVGKDASLILESIGIKDATPGWFYVKYRMITICTCRTADADHAIVRCKTFED